MSNYVFIVDDDLSVRNALSRLLRVAGYNVRTFVCAEDFLDAVESEMLGCIILDLGLPGMTGEKLAEKLKDRGDGMKIIILSAVDNQETRRIAEGINAVGFFRKPVDGYALIDAINWSLKTFNQKNNH
ncbi:MAG: response regulator [Bacteroidetes bacterium]|nr:response regulator [Bacteroidota bacterium]